MYLIQIESIQIVFLYVSKILIYVSKTMYLIQIVLFYASKILMKIGIVDAMM